MVFTIYGHGGHLESRIKTILAFSCLPGAWKRHMKFGYISPSGFRGGRLKMWTDDGRTTKASHSITSPEPSAQVG